MENEMNVQLPIILPLTVGDRMNCERDANIPPLHEDMHAQNLNNSSIEQPMDGYLTDNREELEKIAENGEGPALSCVDYLEIMHEEMLNPDMHRTSESDGSEENSSLACTQTQCNFSTTDMEAYLKHEYEHVDGKSYQCDVCNMKFNLFSNMRAHRMSHLNSRPYKCRLCSKEFVRKDALVEHLVKQHSKQRPYRCPFCPKHFKLRPQLKLHLSNEHSAAILIKTCKLCGFKAESPNAFKSHFAICYTKRNRHVSESNGMNLAPVHCSSAENTAMDLAAMPPNFYVPMHYAAPYIVTGEGSSSLPGPSDIPQILSLRATKPPSCIIATGKVDKQYPTETTDPTTPTRISSMASSTTTTSPNASSNITEPQNLVMKDVRLMVKSEPSEPPREDSQNSNALPTSTMDLSANSMVETSYNFTETSCRRTSPDTLSRIKAACSFVGDNGLSTSREVTNARLRPIHVRACCNVHQRSKCEAAKASTSRCTTVLEVQSCQMCHRCGKRDRHSDSDSQNENDPTQQGNTQPPSNKRVCHDKSTGMESGETVAGQTSSSCHNHRHHHHQPHAVPHTDSATEPTEDNKCNIFAKKPECDNFSCPYCEIVFPDQTLYFLHRSLHSETHPWKCNLCGKFFKDKYEFNSHIISQSHH